MFKIRNYNGEYCLLKKEYSHSRLSLKAAKARWSFVGPEGSIVKDLDAAKKSKEISDIYSFIDELA